MKSQARVVVIGGGIAGVSTLYHLTREGWTDVVLVERDDLTSGSTWHAAGQVAHFATGQTQFALKKWSTELYRELAADPEYPVDYHVTGGTRLAYTQNELDTYKYLIDMASGIGVETELIDAHELSRRHPLINTDRILGAWWDPLDGDIDPSQLTMALAKRARKNGAEIYRHCPVEGIERLSNGEFRVITAKGDIVCEQIVNATGYRVNEVGRMLGAEHPVTAMEHMYFLTEPLDALQKTDRRVPIIRCTEADFYCRQEKQGLLVGIYEQDCKTFGMDGIDPDFTSALCPSDLDRCLPNVERIFARIPALADAGIHSIICGPIPYSLDGAALIGPIPAISNAFAALGLRIGIGDGGGYGKALAQIMVHGVCEFDTWALDPRRFTAYANTELTSIKAIEDYQNEFHLHLPYEFRPAGRLARTTPLYLALDKLNPEWGVVNGWERPLYFKPDPQFEPVHGYRFSRVDEVVGNEVRAITNNAGIIELSGFNRFELKGKGAGEFLDRMICGRMPKKDGKVNLAYLLNDHGNVLTEATITRLGEDHYWYGSAAATEWHDRDWLLAHLPDGVILTEMAATHTILVVMGPNARDLLQSVSPRCDWSAEGFPWLTAERKFIGSVSVLATCVSFSGEPAFELHVANEQLLLLWEILMQVGEAFSLTPYGNLALESMRLEKGYLHWKAEITTERNPYEMGLDRFINLDKADFVGRDALIELSKSESGQKLCVMTVACDEAPAHHGNSVFHQGARVGSLTSGGFGYRVNKNIAIGYVDTDYSEIGTGLEICILGEHYPAVVVEPCLYDPGNTRLR